MSKTTERPTARDWVDDATDEGIRRGLQQLGILPRMAALEASNIIAEAQYRNNLLTARAREQGEA